jgi:isocitrate/isopropylmalate dehydrogenase
MAQLCDAVLLGAGPRPGDPLSGPVRMLCRRLHLHTVVTPLPSTAPAVPPRASAEVEGTGERVLVRDLAAVDDHQEDQARPTQPDGLVPSIRVALRAASRHRSPLLVVAPEAGGGCAAPAAWHELVDQLAAGYPDITAEHVDVETARERLGQRGTGGFVVLACGPARRVLYRASSAAAGSPGLLPAAVIGDASLGLFAPAHGPAPGLVGRSVANPLGALRAGSLLLRHGLQLVAEANLLETAVRAVVREGRLTPDLAATPEHRVGTEEVVARVLAHLADAATGRAS